MPLPKRKRTHPDLSKRDEAIASRLTEKQRQYSEVSEQVRSHAEKLYRYNKFLCSEAVFTVVNDQLGKPADPAMVKMASGFPVGVGMSGCICGAVAGGVMALGLKHGREAPGERLSGDIQELSAELHDRFQRRNGSTCCRKLIKHVEFGSSEHKKQCIRFTGEVAADVVDLIKNGLKGFHGSQNTDQCGVCNQQKADRKRSGIKESGKKLIQIVVERFKS